MSLRRFVQVLGLFALTGCSGSSSSATGQLRFVQASPDAPHVNLLADGKSLATNLAFGNVSDYMTLKSGPRHIQVVPVNSSSPVLDTTISISTSGKQTLLLTGPVAHVQSDLVTDGGTTATAGDGNVRVLNAASKMASADAYLIPSGTSLMGVQPVTSNLSYDKDTGYKLVAAGSFEVFMTAAGTTNVFLATGPINLTASQDQTVVVLDGTSSGFSFTVLIDP